MREKSYRRNQEKRGCRSEGVKKKQKKKKEQVEGQYGVVRLVTHLYCRQRRSLLRELVHVGRSDCHPRQLKLPLSCVAPNPRSLLCLAPIFVCQIKRRTSFRAIAGLWSRLRPPAPRRLDGDLCMRPLCRCAAACTVASTLNPNSAGVQCAGGEEILTESDAKTSEHHVGL